MTSPIGDAGDSRCPSTTARETEVEPLSLWHKSHTAAVRREAKRFANHPGLTLRNVRTQAALQADPMHDTLHMHPLQMRRLLLSGALVLAVAIPVSAQGTKADYERAKGLGRAARGTVRNDRIRVRWINDGAQLTYSRRAANGSRETITVHARTGRRAGATKKISRDEVATAVARRIDRPLTAQQRSRLVVHEIDADHVLVQHGRTTLLGYRTDDGVVVQDLATDHPLKLAPLKQRQRGRRRSGTDETSIWFVNDTDDAVELFWQADPSSRRPYGTIPAKTVRRQQTFAGHRWLVVGSGNRTLARFAGADTAGIAHVTGTPAPRRRESRRPPPSPVSVQGHDLFLARANGKKTRLTNDGTQAFPYGGPFVSSPDGRYVMARHRKRGEGRLIHMIESSPPRAVQPKLHERRYAKPGDRIDIAWPVLFDTRAAKQIPIDHALFANPFSLQRFRWDANSKRLTFLYNQRGHQALKLIEIEAATGKARVVIDERSKTFINYSNKTFLHWLDETHECIWMSERSGWNHLYLVDSRTGAVKNPITTGAWVVRAVDHVDAQRRVIWFRAMGIHPDQDPYHIHYCRVGFDGSGLVALTQSDGTHTANFSPDRSSLVATWSRIDHAPVMELRHGKTGKLLATLERTDITKWLELGTPVPERFVAKGRDGKTDIWGVIFRPSNFDPKKRYPVIEAIYAGPHGQHVPKAFRTTHQPQGVAEIGFVVVKIDGMGTNWRSKAFHDVAWKNLKDAGFPDRIAWIKAAAAKYPQLDISRVGIYGGSAGGQNAMRALLDHGDFYDAAVADCGCHDNRMDKIWWNEAWMGWPIDESYAASSNVTDAKKLQGKLLLTVGELDRNVDPASTMQVVNALIAADKDFDLVVFPGRGHGAGGGAYGQRRRNDFFVRHLWGLEPRR